MKRIQLFEFTDLPWYPDTFRQMQTDYLQFASTLSSGHTNIVPLIIKAMKKAETSEIIDLCSGGSGPWLNLQKQLADAGRPVKVKLTDKFPSPKTVAKFQSAELQFLPEPVDAMNVPEDLKGMRTMFEGFHHFSPEQAISILQNAADAKAAIGVFDASIKMPAGLAMLLLSPVITILTYLFITPFMKPRRLSRFIFTYLLPFVPLATCWDGVVSMLRVYSPDEAEKLTEQIKADGYIWETGVASTGTPIFNFTYIIGYPEGERAEG